MTTASASASQQGAPDLARFAIGFDQRDRARLHSLIDEVLDSNRWSEADMNARFEAAWAAYNDAPAVALSPARRAVARCDSSLAPAIAWRNP